MVFLLDECIDTFIHHKGCERKCDKDCKYKGFESHLKSRINEIWDTIRHKTKDDDKYYRKHDRLDKSRNVIEIKHTRTLPIFTQWIRKKHQKSSA